ncbi:unnamed protein product, partial [marine sediment metagenome]
MDKEVFHQQFLQGVVYQPLGINETESNEALPS